jgi:hypothetical protein
MNTAKSLILIVDEKEQFSHYSRKRFHKIIVFVFFILNNMYYDELAKNRKLKRFLKQTNLRI